MGSPPRGRGKAGRQRGRDTGRGITPAWAGKRFNCVCIVDIDRDHPRVGGEKAAGRKGVLPCLGSPPRGRGKARQDFRPEHRPGITPAWAGKRIRSKSGGSNWRDHPRVGGEKSRSCCCSGVYPGSPPRGRGKGSTQPCSEQNAGITPAWAGKRPRRTTSPSKTRDHPRVGGEKSYSHAPLLPALGSPPRGRGKEWGCSSSVCSLRITPAWAGKSRYHR